MGDKLINPPLKVYIYVWIRDEFHICFANKLHELSGCFYLLFISRYISGCVRVLLSLTAPCVMLTR